MGKDELENNQLTKSDKMLGLIAVGLGLFIAYNVWGGIFGEMISEMLKHSIRFLK